MVRKMFFDACLTIHGYDGEPFMGLVTSMRNRNALNTTLDYKIRKKKSGKKVFLLYMKDVESICLVLG